VREVELQFGRGFSEALANQVAGLMKSIRESDKTHQRLARWHKLRAFKPTARRGGKRK